MSDDEFNNLKAEINRRREMNEELVHAECVSRLARELKQANDLGASHLTVNFPLSTKVQKLLDENFAREGDIILLSPVPSSSPPKPRAVTMLSPPLKRKIPQAAAAVAASVAAAGGLPSSTLSVEKIREKIVANDARIGELTESLQEASDSQEKMFTTQLKQVQEEQKKLRKQLADATATATAPATTEEASKKRKHVAEVGDVLREYLGDIPAETNGSQHETSNE
jgi:hypothetical protein